jgi:hypothetical protein
MGDQRTQRERMLAGDLYRADDPVLAAESRRAQTLSKAFSASEVDEDRRRILRQLLGAFGEAPRSVRRSTATTAITSTSTISPADSASRALRVTSLGQTELRELGVVL